MELLHQVRGKDYPLLLSFFKVFLSQIVSYSNINHVSVAYRTIHVPLRLQQPSIFALLGSN